MKLTFLLIQIVLLLKVVFGTDCGAIIDESCCNGEDACEWEDDVCQCKVLVPIDIIFGIDKSGSMGGNVWTIVTGWLEYIIPQITADARIAWIPFDSTGYPDTHTLATPWPYPALSHWTMNPLRACCNKAEQTAALLDYVEFGLPGPGGGTNTAIPAIQALSWFNPPTPGREQILIIVTDGQGGDPCAHEAAIKAAGIRTIIVGIGPGYGPEIECLLSDPDDLYIVPNFENIDDINARFVSQLCPEPPSSTTTMDPIGKCDEGCHPHPGPCMHKNLGDYTCHQYNAFGLCPEGTFDCGLDHKCMEPCHPGTYGDCMSQSMGDYTCWPKSHGACPPGTMDCGMYPAVKLKGEIDESIKNEEAFEASITKDIRLMILIIGVAFIVGFACIIAILSYQCRSKSKPKHLGFTKVVSTDPDTETTVG